MGEHILTRYKSESWETARAYAANVGAIPPAFASLVKCLQSDLEKQPSDQSLSDVSRSQLKRLLRSESFRASFYYSLRITHSEQLQDIDYLDARTLSKMMKGEDLCYFLLVMFYFKRLQKKLADNALWYEFSDSLCSRADVGMLVGRCLSNVGIGAGLLGATAQFIGTLAFLTHDENGFERYRNRCKKDGVQFDLHSEFERWGCNGLQVFVYLGQNFGLKRPLLEGIAQALDPATELDSIKEKKFYRFRISREWTESLLSIGSIPDMTHRGEFYPVESNMTKLLNDIQMLERLSGNKSWLRRTSEDLSPEQTPQLYDVSSASSPSEQDDNLEEKEDEVNAQDDDFDIEE